MKYYSEEKNIQILIALLKSHNIRKAVVSPGTTNITFVASLQNDDFFQLYSCVDERAACYMACGLAEESGEPVILSCTGATASRNYMSGLTEAFYRKIPILAITSAQHFGRVGHLCPQVIDRSSPLNDIVKVSVQVPSIQSDEDEWAANVAINKAILELKHNGGGPAHINITTNYNMNFNVKNLPKVRSIDRFEYNDTLPELKAEKIGIFVGAHKKWSEQLTNSVDEFCQKYNAVVICDHTSNYHGKYKILANIICDQENYSSPLDNLDLMIHIGNVSGAYANIHAKEVWRVNPDGMIRDTFKKLRYVFEMQEEDFFKRYSELVSDVKKTTFYDNWKNEFDKLELKANECELPFSNLWIARNMIKKLEDDSVLHLAILNSLRSWNYFDTDKKINVFSNTGGFGIDGLNSTLLGASLVNKNKTYYSVIGDLAFFYDLNTLGNRNFGNNVRILLINNGCGTEFHNYSHMGHILGEQVCDYVAADGHFGNKSTELVKNYVNNLGFEYINAKDKKEFLQKLDYFTDKNNKKSIVFEVFTDSKDESDALKIIRSLNTSFSGVAQKNLKKILSPKIKNKIKKILNK